MRFFSPSKYFRSSIESYTRDNNFMDKIDGGLSGTYASSITVRENDLLTINCTVGVSKPAAELSVWLIRDSSMTRLDPSEYVVSQNKDQTMRTYAVVKYAAKRIDNNKNLVCLAENVALEEKWKTQKILNILCKSREYNYFELRTICLSFYQSQMQIHRFAAKARSQLILPESIKHLNLNVTWSSLIRRTWTFRGRSLTIEACKREPVQMATSTRSNGRRAVRGILATLYAQRLIV
jgi:hypothetical protein